MGSITLEDMKDASYGNIEGQVAMAKAGNVLNQANSVMAKALTNMATEQNQLALMGAMMGMLGGAADAGGNLGQAVTSFAAAGNSASQLQEMGEELGPIQGEIDTLTSQVKGLTDEINAADGGVATTGDDAESKAKVEKAITKTPEQIDSMKESKSDKQKEIKTLQSKKDDKKSEIDTKYQGKNSTNQGWGLAFRAAGDLMSAGFKSIQGLDNNSAQVFQTLYQQLQSSRDTLNRTWSQMITSFNPYAGQVASAA